MQPHVDAKRVSDDIDELGEMGRTQAGGLTRRALSHEDKLARDFVVERMQSLGLAVTIDEVGNIFGFRAGKGRTVSPVLAGSHIDSVVEGGRFDGPLGVCAPLEVVRAWNEARVETEAPLVVAVFTGEEGSRFPRGTLGSAAMVGDLPVSQVHALRDAQGVAFVDALRALYPGALAPALRPLGAFRAAIELHIEQGAVLEGSGASVGVVESIAGLIHLRVRVAGDANHAGTTPMRMRRDALACAAEFILAVESTAISEAGGVVATVGKMRVLPGAFNIIPSEVVFEIDLRGPDEERITAASRALHVNIDAIARRRPVAVALEEVQRIPATLFSQHVYDTIARAAGSVGVRALRMPSGAIHDARHVAKVAPTAMVFAPSKGGKSHCPEEFTSTEQIAPPLATLERALADLCGTA